MNIISTEKAPGAIGPYSQGYTVGGLVFTSGQIPVDPATGAVAEGIAAQADRNFPGGPGRPQGGRYPRSCRRGL